MHHLQPGAAASSALRRLGKIVFQPLHYADVEIRIPDVDKARELLGFEPKVDLDEGLERTVAWYREKIALDSLVSNH